MSRTVRQESATGLYHTMIRGVDRQDLFFDAAHYNHFLAAAKAVSDQAAATVLSYALMPNHVHLLMEGGVKDLGVFFQRLGTRYVTWFNRRHDRTGHLFQGRFKSKPVETDAYLAAVVAYIHMNPVRAGLSATAAAYPWSSASLEARSLGLADQRRLNQLIGAADAAARLREAEAEWGAAVEGGEPTAEPTLRTGRPPRHTSAEIGRALLAESGASSLEEFFSLPDAARLAAARRAVAGGMVPRAVAQIGRVGRHRLSGSDQNGA
ncbi:MAG: transposase [Bifidobacteriaceae bacterium]|jgi:REP element-mobilizing transposase RayT|nr:transposase [Bifidobacteriaceae bacterium]